MSVSSHHSFLLSMTEEVSFWRFGKHATPQMGSMCVCVQPCDPRENFFPRFYVHMFTSRGHKPRMMTCANEASHPGGYQT